MGRDGLGVTRRGFLAGAAGLATLAAGMRIGWLNSRKGGLEVVGHQMGEWVDLDGAFCSISAENTRGYFVRVADAQIMSLNQYLEAYVESGVFSGERSDCPSLAVLTIDIRNDGHVGDGGLNLFEMYLVAARGNEYMVEDTDLFVASESKLREAGANGWRASIKEGTEYTIHLPFIHNTAAPGCYSIEMADREFCYYASNLPVRHSISVAVSERS